MRQETWDKLEEIFNRFPVMKAQAVETDDVNKLAEEIGFNLPDDYKEFVLRYGGAIVGSFSIFGVKIAKAMSSVGTFAIDMTKRLRKDGWKGTNNWLIISMDHSGNPIGLDKDGRIWISDHDAGEILKLGDNFEEFLRTYCLKWEK